MVFGLIASILKEHRPNYGISLGSCDVSAQIGSGYTFIVKKYHNGSVFLLYWEMTNICLPWCNLIRIKSRKLFHCKAGSEDVLWGWFDK